MGKKLHLTLSCGDYEITRPLIEGLVVPEGIELTILSSNGARDRQWRLGRNAECDVGELNACAYFMAREREHPYVALPVFPHRRFRHGFIFINANKGITKPTDLSGRRIGIESGFQPAAAVWQRGILSDEYGVVQNDIIWVTDRDEDIPFDAPPGLRIERVAAGTLDGMLVTGEIDGLLSPSFPPSILAGNVNVRRLIPDEKEVEQAYYKKTGIFPIMHLVVIRKEITEQYPWVAPNLAFAFNESKRLAYQRVQNPRVVPLAWFSTAWEEQKAFFKHDPWEYGLTQRNTRNIGTLIRYCHEQGLIKKNVEPIDSFVKISEEALQGTSRF
jgi:4,5-dihydroxyphthalate decarboxylase